MANRELLLEIRSGEIPAQMQEPARIQLQENVTTLLKETNLSFDQVKTYVGPRRLVAVVEALEPQQADQTIERRGPRVDAPEKAIEGFLKSTGAKREELKERQTDKGKFLFHSTFEKGKPTIELLPLLVDRLLTDFKWPKAMTWGTSNRTWIRPISGGICIYDEKPCEFTLNFSSEDEENSVLVKFDNTTIGHRFMAPSPFSVKNFSDYALKLKKAFVVVNQEERKEIIRSQIADIESEHDLKVVMDEDLLNEVCGLVEWPVAVLGTIDDAFKDLPDAVLQTSMRVHQRYFCTQNNTGKLLPKFILVANQHTQDHQEEIRIGNERVLRARLSDAAFFIEQDQKITLLQRSKKLNRILFHQQLGTMLEKQERVKKLLPALFAGKPRVEEALKAAGIFKADLVSELVFEFTELQGIVGAYYAQAEGYSDPICQAISDQYRPKSTNDDLPQGMASQYLGFCDRLDTLVGFFAIDLKPTGSKDPFALRRSALGLIRFLESDLKINLPEALRAAWDLFEHAKVTTVVKDDGLNDLLKFVMDRLRVYWREQGFDGSHINAVLSLGLEKETIFALRKRLEALHGFLNNKDKGGDDLLQGYKRSRNILGDIKISDLNAPNPKLFEKDAETALFKILEAEKSNIRKLIDSQDYQISMEHLARLRSPIDVFFEDVHIQDDRQEVRENRLALLGEIITTIEQVADFSKIS